jgi:hypothetical protein
MLFWSILAMEMVALTVVATPRLLGKGTYQLASAPQQGTVVAIRFAQEATLADITDFLKAYKASIIVDQHATGFHRVRVSDAPLSAEELSDRLTRMKQEKIVDLIATQ